MTMALWDVIRAEAMTCQSAQELIPQDIFAFYGNQMMTEMDMQQSLRSSLAKRQKEQPQNRERSAEQLFDILESVALAVKGSDLGTAENTL